MFFIQLCHENPKAQKALLGGFEKMVELRKNALLPKVPHIVKVILVGICTCVVFYLELTV